MTADLAVAGLGYVGLPLARQACAAGLSTVGYDTSSRVVTGLNNSRSHVHDVADAAVDSMIEQGFAASTDPAILGTADTVVICVPTGLNEDKRPDLDAVRAAAHAIAGQLRPGMLVVLESTSFPGTTEEVLLPILESGSGLIAGHDFHVGYSPERVDPGNRYYDIGNTPKIVSGHTALCAKYCAAFYGRFVDTLVVARGTREAEMAKLLENTYRYVNIALVNEIATYCDHTGLDVWDVLHCAGTKPFGFAAFTPGPGVGGHCIPIDPVYLASRAKQEGFNFGMLAAARSVNDAMPRHIAGRARQLLAGRDIDVRGAEVLLLGVAYKPDVADVRESPAFAVARELLAMGTRVTYHDPDVREFTVDGHCLPRATAFLPAAWQADLTILLQDHACYENPALARMSQKLFDTRGKVAGAGVQFL